MFIKLGIIAGIVILGGMIFSNEIDNLFPTTSATVIDSLKDDAANFGSKASDSVEQRIDESIDKITDKTGNAITNEISEAGDKISNEISEEVSNFNPIESIQNIFTGGSSPHSSESFPTSSTTSSTPTTSTQTSTQSHPPITYETLSLSTTQQADDNILLQYSDSSGKTSNVSVVIRTEQKEVFSGIFYSSMFQTTVNDANGVPYFIDMVIEHAEYGTVTSSVFNPGEDSDTKISGVFANN